MFPLMFLIMTIKHHTVFILDKPLVMTENDHEGFYNNSIKFWICKTIWRMWSENKNHGHIIGRYRGSAQQHFNLNLGLRENNPIVFRN